MKKNIITVLYIIFVLSILAAASFIISNNKQYETKSNPSKEVKEIYTEIDIEQFNSLYYGEDLALIYLGKNNCSHCDSQNEILENTLANVSFPLFYLNVDKVSDEDYLRYLKPLHEDIIENGVSTPTFLLVSNGEVKMYKKGVTSEINLLKLLLKNEFLK